MEQPKPENHPLFTSHVSRFEGICVPVSTHALPPFPGDAIPIVAIRNLSNLITSLLGIVDVDAVLIISSCVWSSYERTLRVAPESAEEEEILGYRLLRFGLVQAADAHVPRLDVGF